MNYTQIFIHHKPSKGKLVLKYEGTDYVKGFGRVRCSGHLADVHECDGYLIGISAFNIGKPLFVANDIEDMKNKIIVKYGVVPHEITLKRPPTSRAKQL